MGRILSGRSVLSVFLFASLGATACTAPGSQMGGGGSSSAQVSQPKRIAVAIRGNPPTLSSTVSGTATTGSIPGVADIENLVNAGLTLVDSDGERRGWLADSAPTVENGSWRVAPDGTMETTWTIRPNAVWHDGTPFTAEDVLFTAQVARDRELIVFRHIALDAIQTVEAPDPRTLLVKWKQPYIDANILFTKGVALPLPKHLLEETYAERKASLTDAAYWSRDFVGTGPYKLQEWAEGSHLILEANDRYVFGRPKIDSIEVKFVGDPNTLFANLLAGSVHLTLGRGISLDQGMQLQEQWTDGRLELSAVTSGLTLFPQLLNPSPAVLGDARMRKALMHAIDRQELVETLQAGVVPVAHSLFPPQEPEYKLTEPALVVYPYDPRRAAQIIEELGYSRGGDGGFRERGGQRLNVEIQAVVTTEINEKAMLAVADYWQKNGVTTDSVPIPVSRQGEREFRSLRPGFDLASGGGWSALNRLYSAQAPLPENGFVGTNKTRYMNKDFDALLDRYFTTIPMTQRIEVMRQIVRQVSDQLIFMPLLFEAQSTMISKHLHGVQANLPSGSTITWNAADWDWQ